MKPDICIIGASVLDVIVSPADRNVFDTGSSPANDISLNFGGDALNESILLSHMGKKVYLQALLGTDQAGQIIYKHTQELGISIDASFLRPELKTAVNVVLVQENGERNFLTNQNGTLRRLQQSDLKLTFPDSAGILCFASIFVFPKIKAPELSQIFKAAKEQELLVCADMTKRKNKETILDLQEALPYIDYLFPNKEEAFLFTGCSEVETAAQALFDAGVKNVVLKCGKDGCYLHTAQLQKYIASTPVSAPVDTTGAGDSFVSGFLYGLSEEWPLERCASYANSCGAKCVEKIGACTWCENP